MARTLPVGETGRLERSCGRARPDWVRSRDLLDGVHALQAWFGGRGYEPHRHDVYTIGLTDVGLQAFDYRGAARLSRPGQVVVLHPDEVHDGRAATREGFGYRAIYVAPAHVAEAARALRGRAVALPFVREPVIASARLARAIEDAFADDPEPLAVDDLVVRVTGALLDAAPSCGNALPLPLDSRAVARARQFLEAETTRVVRAGELEAVSGLSRYELARQFRAALGTSPYRYSLMRRLDRARALLSRRQPPAEVALATGFADQAHLTRMFKAGLGVTPARYRGLATLPTAARRA
jgi:AraC-like DNA-binding protein